MYDSPRNTSRVETGRARINVDMGQQPLRQYRPAESEIEDCGQDEAAKERDLVWVRDGVHGCSVRLAGSGRREDLSGNKVVRGTRP